MVNDALKLTIDQAFPPKKGQLSYEKDLLSPFDVPGHDDQTNLWHHLIDLDSW